MQTQPPSNPSPRFPMQELELIESTIKACSQWILRPQWLAILESRSTTLLANLDLITRPQPVSPRFVTKTIRRGFEYRGIVYGCRYSIDIYIHLLRRLWTNFPDRREAMAQAMGSRSRKRTYVAKTPAKLFPGQPLAFANKHSRTLVEDWYVDTNLNPKLMRRILPDAVAAAGPGLDRDVKINWERTSTS